MATKSLAVPPRIEISALLGTLPVNLQPYAGTVLEATEVAGWFQAHFTPTGTSGTLNADTLAVTGCTASLIQNNAGTSGGDLPGAGQVVVIAARRKAGTSGAIADQDITFTINSVAVAKIFIDGVAASGDPEFGYFLLVTPLLNPDERFNLGAYNTISWSCSAADSDVEFCIFIGGPL